MMKDNSGYRKGGEGGRWEVWVVVVLLLMVGGAVALTPYNGESVDNMQMNQIIDNGTFVHDIGNISINQTAVDDSDGDGISDIDETNGFTWNGVTYYTDPFQKSTDFDPYNDYKEITTINMDPTVQAPGRHPLVPSYPDLKVDIGKITVNTLTKITSTRVLENYSTWDINTVTVDTTNENWGANIEAKAGFSGWSFSPYAEVKASEYFDYAHTLTSTTISTASGWNKEEWSMATAVDTDKAARLKYYLKIKNNGTDTAKNVRLKFNVKIGDNIIATITTSEILNRIDPYTVFPLDTFIVIDRDDFNEYITVSLNELRSIELGAPLTIEILEIYAEVPWENEQYTDWSDYKASIDRTSAKIVLDTGSGVREYRVFSGIRYPASGNPYYFMNVTLENATLNTLGGGHREDGVYIGGEKVEDWRFGFDNSTFSEVVKHLNKTNGSLLSIPIKQGWTIVMKPPDKEPPRIHWAVYTNDLKGIQASVSDNENVVNVTAYVKIRSTYQNITLKDDNKDLIYEATLLEKVTDTYSGYITADDGKQSSNLRIFIPNIIVDDDLADDPPNRTWNTIQKGINNATEGDIIDVRNGTYKENVIIYKQLFLIGEDNNNTVIDGRNSGNVIEVKANGITISGLRIQNGSNGINVSSGSNVISNNVIMFMHGMSGRDAFGISVYSSTKNILTGNLISNIIGGTGAWGINGGNGGLGGISSGIYLSDSSNNTLISNTIRNIIGGDGGNGDSCGRNFHCDNSRGDGGYGGKSSGIYLSSSSNNTLTSNTINLTIGGAGGEGGSCLGYDCDMSLGHSGGYGGNSLGIYLINSANNTLIRNKINNMTGGAGGTGGYCPYYIQPNFYSFLGGNGGISSGVYLSDSNISTLAENFVSNMKGGAGGLGINTGANGVGYNIYLSAAFYKKIYSNIFNNTNNFYFSGSNINTWNITKQSGINILGGSYIGGNVWANPESSGFSQKCDDINKDGICDSAYVLDSNNTDYLPLAYSSAAGPVHNINKSTNYATIQAAINDASPGNEIHVDSGTYYENVKVNRSVKLIGAGADATKVKAANASDHVFSVNVNNVNITGFKIMGATADQKSGIFLNSSSNNSLTGNIVANNSYGIYLYGILLWGEYPYGDSNNNTLMGNIVNSNSGYGIYLISSSNNIFNNNTVSSNGAGINLESFAMNNNFNNNMVISNGGGISLSFGCSGDFNNNMVISNGGGIFLSGAMGYFNNNTISLNGGTGIFMYEGGASIINNNISSNGGDGIYDRSYGYEASYNNNIINSNGGSGIYLESVYGKEVTNNTLSMNAVAGIYVGYWGSNDIYNNFFNNSINVGFNEYSYITNYWNITKTPGTNIIGGPYLGGNFWAHPNGIGFSQTCMDTDGDGICDSAYILDDNNTDYLPLASPPNSSITVVSPDGGENWEQGLTRMISWNYTGSPGPNVRIELLKNGMLNSVLTSSTSIGSGGSGSYTWQISLTQTPGTDYRVRINSTIDPAYTDTSNNDFTISSPPGKQLKVNITPALQTVGTGKNLSIIIFVNLDNFGISAGQIDLKFNASAFRVTSITKGDILGNDAFDTGSNIDNTAGTVSAVLARNGPTSVPTNPGNWTTVDLIVNQTALAGTYPINITFTGIVDETFTDIANIRINNGSIRVISLPGDINCDCIVNYKDLGILGLDYGKRCGEPGYREEADLNRDCIINYKDLGILGANYGKTC